MKSAKPKIRDPSSSPTRPVLDVLDNQMEQLAGELQRRRAKAAAPPPPLPPSAPGATAKTAASATNKSRRTTNTGKHELKKTCNMEDEDDPGVLLNAWLGELDSLQKGLEATSNVASSASRMMTPSTLPGNASNDNYSSSSICSSSFAGRPFRPSPSPSPSTCSTSTTGSASAAAHLRRMSTPRMDSPSSGYRMGSPRLDSYRYSLINLEESLEHDLDAILGELCALESNFNNNNGNHNNGGYGAKRVDAAGGDVTPVHEAPPPPAPLHLDQLLASEPQYISPESVRQRKMASKAVSTDPGLSSPNGAAPASSAAVKRTDSPDTDSAFCEENTDSNSSNSSNGKAMEKAAKEESAGRSAMSSIGKASAVLPPDAALSPSSEKAEKIRLAIEKMKEASVKKIFIKVFGEDGSAKSLLVDERMNVAQVCHMLAEKNRVKRDTSWGLVELLPDLHMERAYEDHEPLVENLLMWKADSKNTLWFIKRPEVYDLFVRPELYLLGDTSSQIGTDMEDRARAELVEEYFSSTGVGAPEVEGFLWLKAEAKKAWKRFYFVLRTSGLYYAPKGKKTSRDLVCLAGFDVNQVYFGVKWHPKFKAPSRHCFAIKHPQIQAKNPKYIRYLCSDTEIELNKWVTGIRLAKYGRTLYENYRAIIEEIAHEDIDRLASARLSSVNVQSEADQIRLAGKKSTDRASHRLSNTAASSILTAPPKITSPSPSPSGSSATTRVIVHSSHSGGVHCRSSSSRSSSTGSLSSNLTNGEGGGGGGFSCDSPEGGTIKKKPSANKSALVTFKSDGGGGGGAENGGKAVRFKDTFSTIGDRSPPLMAPSYATLRRPSASGLNGGHEGLVYRNIDDILGRNRSVLEHNGRTLSREWSPAKVSDLDFPESPLKRRFSQESLVSNPAMLHSGTLIESRRHSPGPQQFNGRRSSPVQLQRPRVQPPLPPPSPPPPPSSSSPPQPHLQIHQKPAAAVAPQQLTSPQPQRPAPVLKPLVSRKPSVDKSFLLKKQQQLEAASAVTNGAQPEPQLQQQHRPTYEETLQKCQNLTKMSPLDAQPSDSPLGRQISVSPMPQIPPKSVGAGRGSGSPQIPPKPALSLAGRVLKLDNSKKISHLPPSGLGRGRSSSLNRSQFLNDLENAMSAGSQKTRLLSDSSESPNQQSLPFPNRYSSGEYENVNGGDAHRATVNGERRPPPPPLPKRSEETQLQAWNRT